MCYQPKLHGKFVQVEQADGRMVVNVFVVVVVVVAFDVVAKQHVAVAVDIDTKPHCFAAVAAAVVTVDYSTLDEEMDAYDMDVAHVKYIGTLNLLDENTSMDVGADVDVDVDVHEDDDADDVDGMMRVVALDKAWNVLVLPSFVVDQDDNRPSDQLRI